MKILGSLLLFFLINTASFAAPSLQEKIWNCEDLHRPKVECDSLKDELRKILISAPFEKVELDSKLASSSSGKGNILKLKFQDDVYGVFKPDNQKLEGLSGAAIDWHREDRHSHEIAVYQLSEMFGFGVPMVVERTVDGRVGALQVYVKNTAWALSEYSVDNDANPREIIEYTHVCSDRRSCKVTLSEAQQFRRMRVLDYLVKNWDRYFRNWLYQKSTHRIIPIDHAGSFNYKNTANPHGTTTFEEALKHLKKDAELTEKFLHYSESDLHQTLAPFLAKDKLIEFLSRFQNLKDGILGQK
jgi:hypothetical protein